MPEKAVHVVDELRAPLEEAELLLFLLDGSGSMTETSTHDGRQKVAHLMEVLADLIPRLRSSGSSDRFRAQAIYFSAIPSAQGTYCTLDNFVIDNPVSKAGGGSTAISSALDKAATLLDDFQKDQTLPPTKLSTVFLITDGHETVKHNKDVENSAGKLKGHPIAPILASVGVGKDVDEALLSGISSEPTPRQLRHLEYSKLVQFMPKKDKLYLRAHEQGRITKQTAEALRNFVYVLSKTAKKEE